MLSCQSSISFYFQFVRWGAPIPNYVQFRSNAPKSVRYLIYTECGANYFSVNQDTFSSWGGNFDFSEGCEIARISLTVDYIKKSEISTRKEI